jgi:hypothetical protein
VETDGSECLREECRYKDEAYQFSCSKGDEPRVEVCTEFVARSKSLESSFDLKGHIARQIVFSAKTFGPGSRLRGILDHVQKELKEIEAEPSSLEEWIDLIILGLDGVWRAGFTPEEICAALEAKQLKNEGRKWPDWRDCNAEEAIEHIRGD